MFVVGFVFSVFVFVVDELVVLVVVSLMNVFKVVGDVYEKQYLDIKVLFNFGVLDVLMQQIVKGVLVDVFVLVDQKVMDCVVNEKVIVFGMCCDFVVNLLVLIVLVDSYVVVLMLLNDLIVFGVKCIVYGDLVLVLVGCYIEGVLCVVGVWDVVSVKGVLVVNVCQSFDYVVCGEVDVGFVFGIDVVIMLGCVKVVLMVLIWMVIIYLIVVVKDSCYVVQVQLFIDFVVLFQGQVVLLMFGFKFVK